MRIQHWWVERKTLEVFLSRFSLSKGRDPHTGFRCQQHSPSSPPSWSNPHLINFIIFFSLDKTKPIESLFIKYTDYPLAEERTLECFIPLNDILKLYNFKKYDDNEIINEYLIEKDERQLRKLRLVSILRNLCEKIDEKTKKKIFDYLITYVKDDIVCFESSSIVQQIPSTNFGVPGDRRITQVWCLENELYLNNKDFYLNRNQQLMINDHLIQIVQIIKHLELLEI